MSLLLRSLSVCAGSPTLPTGNVVQHRVVSPVCVPSGPPSSSRLCPGEVGHRLSPCVHLCREKSSFGAGATRYMSETKGSHRRPRQADSHLSERL